MSNVPVQAVKITKYAGSAWQAADDLLAAEEPLEIRLGYGHRDAREQRRISVTMRTPGSDFELALGFLFTEGIISNPADIMRMRYCTDAGKQEQGNIVRAELHEHIEVDMMQLQRNFYTTSSCGVCGKASIDAVRVQCPEPVADDQLRVQSDMLLSLPATLRAQQNVFEYTGGLHASALFDINGTLLLTREDVGRHNALDKLIGAALGAGMLPLSQHILLLSGRASFELLQKAAMAGIRIVCAVGAPSSLAVQMADESGITLVGFLRDQRFNIYTGPQRIVQ